MNAREKFFDHAHFRIITPPSGDNVLPHPLNIVIYGLKFDSILRLWLCHNAGKLGHNRDIGPKAGTQCPGQTGTLGNYDSRSPQYTHKARSWKAQNNFSYVSQLDVLSRGHPSSMHAQCKTIAATVLCHLLLSKKGEATVVADSSSIQQASGYNTSCMVAYACTGLAIF